MLRTSDAGVNTALDSPNISFVFLAELQFSDGTVRLWAGPKDQVFSYLGFSWTGTGDLGEIREISDADDLSDTRIQAVLHADSSNIDSVEIDDNEGRSATFYIVLFNTTTGAVIGHIAEPREMGGAWAEPKVIDGQQGQRLLLNDLVMEFTSEAAVLERRQVRRLTHDDTREMDPADNFNEFAAEPDLARMQGQLYTRTTQAGTGANTARESQPRRGSV